MKSFFIRNKRVFISILFVWGFLFTFVMNIPSVMLGRIITHYSKGYLVLYNPHGTFWHGDGLLAVANQKSQEISPLLLINWDVKIGLKKFIDINFNVDNTPIAELYINKTGANLDKLDISLSITQVSQMIDIIKTLSLSGNLEITANHINIGKTIMGTLNVAINQVSSNIAPVNPLGNYQMSFDLSNGGINISSNSSANLSISGSGNLQGLTLKCMANPSKKDKMLEFMTVMGIPQPDGSYAMKVF